MSQVDAVSACHSALLSAAQASAALHALTAYHERFRGRLAPGVGPSAKCERLCNAAASTGSSRHTYMGSRHIYMGVHMSLASVLQACASA